MVWMLQCTISVLTAQYALSMALIQPWELITITPSPDLLFQLIVMDLFYVEHFADLICADRLTVWLVLYHLKPGYTITSKLISVCLGLFHTYCAPEKLSNDCDLPSTSCLFQRFFKNDVCEAQTILSNMQLPQTITKPPANGTSSWLICSSLSILYSSFTISHM